MVFKKLLSVTSLVLSCCIVLSYCYTALAAPQSSAKVVIILDDMGNNLPLGLRAIQLPGAINYSFLPQSPNGAQLAQLAYKQGKEVMLHIPMSNIKGQKLGPGALTPIMEKEQFINTVRKGVNSIPHVRGVNNHMGSLLTQLHQPMSWFMEELKQQKLYFVDSRTSPLTVAEASAHKQGVPTLRRHIFLDNHRSEQAISAQFDQLVQLAKKQGVAVAIGHPHPETLSFLEQVLPELEHHGIQLSLVSEIAEHVDNLCSTKKLYRQLNQQNCLKISQSRQ